MANWAYVSGAGPPAGVTLPLISVAVLILVVGMLRQGLFGVVPAALRVIASHDPDGLLVVRGERLVHINPRARELLSPVELAVSAPMPDALGARRLRQDGTRAVPDWDEWWRAVLAPGGALYRYDGDTQRWLRVSAQPVYARGGACGPLPSHPRRTERSARSGAAAGATPGERGRLSREGSPTTSATFSPW